MGDIVTASGSRFFIGPAIASTIDTLAEFQAISGWTEVGLIEDLGQDGDQSTAVTGESVGDSRVRKAKGSRNAGTKTIVCFHDPLDAGQLAMEVAEQDSNNFAFKEVLNDGPVGYNDTVRYFRGLVMSRRQNKGTNNNIIRNTYDVEINSAIMSDPASV
jgi:hypothetical protein